MNRHQYVLRETGQAVDEHFIGDRSVKLLYQGLREYAPAMFRAMTSGRMSSLLAFCHYDYNPFRSSCRGRDLLARMGVDWRECVAPAEHFTTPRRVFERQIRYWDLRPMDDDPEAVASPADARVLIGSLETTPELRVKEKLFCLDELLGTGSPWRDRFAGGDFAVFRLTPDKYHYNHVPVSGRVAAIYTIDGDYHSCNPAAVIALAGLHAKNRRVVTIIDTDVPGGAGIGPVAMIEVVALMIGDISQCYSPARYDDPQPVVPGMMLAKGCPKSLYRPGSSTDILLFARDAVRFSSDLRRNAGRSDVQSRFAGIGQPPCVETDVRVRSTIARKRVHIPPFTPREDTP